VVTQGQTPSQRISCEHSELGLGEVERDLLALGLDGHLHLRQVHHHTYYLLTRDCVWNVLDDCLRDDRAQDRHRPHRVHKDQPPAPTRHVAKPSVPAVSDRKDDPGQTEQQGREYARLLLGTRTAPMVPEHAPEYSAADGEVRGELDGDGRHREHDPQAQEDPRFLKQTEEKSKSDDSEEDGREEKRDPDQHGHRTTC